MIRIPQHIEQLLLHYDCVIVPGLGAFVAHNCSAQYVESEDLFLPPYRSVSFNPRLTDNDGLLTHHIAERNQVTYEAAQKMVKEEVAAIRHKIQEDGKFSFPGIGTLCSSESKFYDFKPIPCGIDAPGLYGLDSYYVSPLAKKKRELSKIGFRKHDSDTLSFSIHMDFIRYAAAVAVAAVFYFICIAPLNTAIQQERSEASMLRFLWASIMPNTEQVVEAETVIPGTGAITTKEEASKITPQEAAFAPQAVPTDAQAKPSTLPEKTKPTEESPLIKQTAALQNKPYTIVVSSAIPETRANKMTAEWREAGLRDTEVLVRKNMVRVIYGHYTSEAEALQVLREYRNSNALFADAWIYKIP